jgi:hypothetical protein
MLRLQLSDSQRPLWSVIASHRVSPSASPMTGSAKKSIVTANWKLDCFVASAPRNDVMPDTSSRSRRASTRVLLGTSRSLNSEGAGNAGRPVRPQPVCNGSKHTVVTTVTPEITRHSLRNGFNGVYRALPGDEFVLSPSSTDEGLSAPGRADFASADLTPATGVRTTRLNRPRQRRSSARRLIAHGLIARPAITCAPNAAASTASRALRP